MKGHAEMVYPRYIEHLHLQRNASSRQQWQHDTLKTTYLLKTFNQTEISAVAYFILLLGWLQNGTKLATKKFIALINYFNATRSYPQYGMMDCLRMLRLLEIWLT